MDKAIILKEIDEISDEVIIESARPAIKSFKYQLKNVIDNSFGDSDFQNEQFSDYLNESEYVKDIFNDWIKGTLV